MGTRLINCCLSLVKDKGRKINKVLAIEVPMPHEKTSSDQALVEKVQQGDKRRFDLLVCQISIQGFIRLIGRYVQDRSEYWIRLKESFIKAYSSDRQFSRGKLPFTTWFVSELLVNRPKKHTLLESFSSSSQMPMLRLIMRRSSVML